MYTNCIDIAVTRDPEEAQRHLQDGYCPVECSFGTVSVVDKLNMDHHGDLSHLEPVSLRAYRDHYGARSDDARFVVTGDADADACFAIASLAGVIPKSTPEQGEEGCFQSLASTIALIDDTPVGFDLESLPMGEGLLLWGSLMTESQGCHPFQFGVDLWSRMLNNSDHFRQFQGIAVQQYRESRYSSLRNLKEHGTMIDDILVVRDCQLGGLVHWYQRNPRYGVSDPRGWVHPLICLWSSIAGRMTIGCPNQQVAEMLFGAGGLLNVFENLKPEGWGGRQAIGGSPRGRGITWGEALNCISLISTMRQA